MVWRLRVLLAFVILASLAACGAPGTTPAPGVAPTSPKPASVAPKPGATLTGAVVITGKASGATITLQVSDDGTAIKSVGVTLQDLKCNGFSAGSMSKQVQGSFAISKGQIAANVSGIGEITGSFTSPTEASGKVNLTLQIPMSGPCELGEFTWSAKAQ